VSRLLVQLLILAVMALAPFGRMEAARAMAMPHQAAMASHCAGRPMPDQDRQERMVDCMIACAATAAIAAPETLAPPAAIALNPVAGPVPCLSGLSPEADPPPPRRT
jgi:hypothetical protein